MSEPEFVLHLGSGVYLDSQGALRQHPGPEAAVYEAPSSLPADVKAVRDALKDTKKALEQIPEDEGAKKVVTYLKELGLDDEGEGMLEILATIGAIAGKLAPVLTVLSFAADLGTMLGLFKAGPTPFEHSVMRRFDLLERHVDAIAAQVTQHRLADKRDQVGLLVQAVVSYADKLNDDEATAEELEKDRSDLITAHTEYAPGVAGLLNESSWASVFRHDEHTLWRRHAHWIYTHPAEASQPPVRPMIPADRALAFDGRLMVPVASYAALAYVTAIRGIVPAHRTTGDFAAQLADNFAPKVERLAQLMREQQLARTLHSADDFRASISAYHVSQGRILWSGRPWVVGALDLRYHDDRFFSPLWAEFNRAITTNTTPATTQRGLLDLHWAPPAVLTEEGPHHFRITNPEECAAAANEKSERDYAALLTMSGYVELLRIAALIRHEATEPSTSQTVEVGGTTRYARAGTPAAVTVSSTIPLTHQVLTSDAVRTTQQFSALARVRTQPLTRTRRNARYRISLRTLTAVTGTDSGGASTYDSFHSTRYVAGDLPSRPQLEVVTRPSALVGEAALELGEEWVQSPVPAPLTREGAVTLKAMTFDTWVPKLLLDPGAEEDAAAFETLTGLGWIGGPSKPGSGRDPGGRRDGGRAPTHRDRFGDLLNGDDGFVLPHAWREYKPPSFAQQRDLRRTEIRLSYRLHWHHDLLQVEVETRPEDRNAVVFLVVEELLPRSGQVLHTVAPLELHNWVTVVPWQFLDRETDAWKHVGPAIAALVPVHLPPAGPVPKPPPLEWVGYAEPIQRTSVSERLASLERDDPSLVARVLAELVR